MFHSHGRGSGVKCLHPLVHLGFHLISSIIFSFKKDFQWLIDAEDALCGISTSNFFFIGADVILLRKISTALEVIWKNRVFVSCLYFF
jgi:hypothetical protein